MSEWFLNSSIPQFAQAFPAAKEQTRFDHWMPGVWMKRPIVRNPHDATEEVTAARTARSRIYNREGTGKKKLIQKLAPIHWQDGSEWKDIDTDIRDGVADQVPFTFTLDTLGVGFSYVSDSGGTIRVKLTEIGGSPFDGGQAYAKTVDGNKVTFADLATDLDIVFEVGRQGVRTLRILKSENAPREFQWEVEYDAAAAGKIVSTIAGQDNRDELQRIPGPTRRDLNLSRTDSDPQDIGGGFSRITSDESWNGETKYIDPDTHVPSWVNEAIYPVGIDPDITENIGDTADDGDERNGTWATNVYPGKMRVGRFSGATYHVGVRFQTVAVPAGATIDLANLILNVINATYDEGAGTIYGYDVDDAAQWTSTIKPSAVTKTSATTSLPRPTSAGLKTYNVTTIVAEIVARGGWATGQDMAFPIISAEPSGYQRTDFEDLSHTGTDEAQLEIDYTEGGGGGSTLKSRLTLLGVGI